MIASVSAACRGRRMPITAGSDARVSMYSKRGRRTLAMFPINAIQRSPDVSPHDAGAEGFEVRKALLVDRLHAAAHPSVAGSRRARVNRRNTSTVPEEWEAVSRAGELVIGSTSTQRIGLPSQRAPESDPAKPSEETSRSARSARPSRE